MRDKGDDERDGSHCGREEDKLIRPSPYAKSPSGGDVLIVYRTRMMPSAATAKATFRTPFNVLRCTRSRAHKV